MSEASNLLEQEFGEIDHDSALLPFDFTDYYTEEMGVGLRRRWVAFGSLKARAYLSRAKHTALQLERVLMRNGRRTVNIDPGYVDNAQVVLSTAKNYAHCIYIGMGYYAEVTLVYVGNQFRPLEWTYPDYRSRAGLEFFHLIRKKYHRQLRADFGS